MTMVRMLLRSFFVGYVILVAAIILNVFAAKFGISTWYDFIYNPSETSFGSYLWLFVIYPLFLGLPAYAVLVILNRKS